MTETQEMWSRRDNRSNKRTDLAYCIAWSKHGLRPVKSRNWPLKNSSTEARSISRHRRCDVPSACDFHLRALEGSPQPNGMVHAAQVRSYIFWSIGLVIHSVTSRLRTLGRAIGSGASTRLASETCCCSLMGRTNTAAPYRRGGAAVDSSSCRGPIPTHRHLAASACAWRYVPVRQPLHAGNFFPRTTVRNFRFSEYR